MKHINWAKLILDLLVVIIGVTIAFGLNKLSEGLSEDRQEEIHLQSLKEDLADDLALFGRLIADQERTIGGIKKLIGMKFSGQVDKDSLGVFWSSMNYGVTFETTNSTLQSLEAGGNLALISDFELRKEIVALYKQSYAAMGQMDEAYRKHTELFTAPYFMQKARYAANGQLNPSILEGEAVVNILFSQQFLAIRRLELYKSCQKACERLVSSIDQELNN